MTSHYIQAWGDPMIGQTAALKKLWEAAYREALVEAFADAYLVIAVCFAISAMMVPLIARGHSKIGRNGGRRCGGPARWIALTL